jgi:hypothetical protein
VTTPTDHVSAAPGAKRSVHIVPHTHWDREWYGGFGDLRSPAVHPR